MSILETLPDEIREWPQWLEARIVNPDLVDLVDDLRLVIRSDQSQVSLATICGAELPEVFKHGLQVLRDEQLIQLLDHPETLFELQEQAFEACSPYWDNLAWRARSPQVGNSLPATQVQKAKRQIPWSLLALAAGLLLAVGVWFSRSAPVATGWGLAKIESLSPDLKDSTYLLRLSELAAQWNNVRPEDSSALLKRLREYRAGCQMLLEHPKPQLKPDDRQWLMTRCQKWASDLDQLIAKLESSQISFEEAKQEAGAIADRMEAVLRDKALELS